MAKKPDKETANTITEKEVVDMSKKPEEVVQEVEMEEVAPTVENADAPEVKPEVKGKAKKVLADEEKSIKQLADEVERGIHGSGRERMLSLGSNYAKVQQEVTRRMRGL